MVSRSSSRRLLSLSSCKMVDLDGFTADRIKPLLMGRSELETLHLIGNRKLRSWEYLGFTDIRIGYDDRMSPVKELILQSYFWNHSPHNAVNFWNWTQVTHLELRDVCMMRFLKSVPPHHLLQLKTLVLDDHCPGAIHEASDLMCDLVTNIKALENLSLKCKPYKAIGPILRHGPTLRSLEIRDYSELGTSPAALSEAGLKRIQKYCPDLMELGINLVFDQTKKIPKGPKTIGVPLTQMRNLRRLTVFTRERQMNLPKAGDEDSYYHLNREVREWFNVFLAAKKGARFEKVVVNMRVDGSFVEDGKMVGACVFVIWTYEEGKGVGVAEVVKDWYRF